MGVFLLSLIPNNIRRKNVFVSRYRTSDGTLREDYRTYGKAGDTSNLKTGSSQSSKNVNHLETKLSDTENEEKVENTLVDTLEFLLQGKRNRIFSGAIASLAGGGLG